MHSGHRLDENFFRDTYPRWHMVLYDAIWIQGFRNRATRFVDKVQEGENLDTLDALWKGEEKFRARRGLRILSLLWKKGYNGILRQLKDAMSQQPVYNDFSADVLQLVPSERWEKRYEKTVYDIVLAVPMWAKVIAVSTTQLEASVDPYEMPRFERVQLSNFHFFPFFNRAHGVRGRLVKQISPTGSQSIDIRRYGFLLRTCKDAEMIGKSARLSAFTPLVTSEGLRLGFYFGVVCRITKVESVPSATGFGFMLGQTRLTLADSTGTVQAYLSSSIFQESMGYPANTGVAKDISDPSKLPEYKGWVFVIAAWFLGDTNPYVALILFLGDGPKIQTFQFISHANTRRKMLLESVAKEWENELDRNDLKDMSHLVNDGKWLYYIEDNWPPEIFLSSAKNNFEPLNFSRTLKLGIDRNEYKKWRREYEVFVKINPFIHRLYTSNDPMAELQRIFAADLGQQTAKSTQVVPEDGRYRCVRCGTTYTMSETETGSGIRFCKKCGSRLEFIPMERSEGGSKSTRKKRRPGRWLGTDSWLRSLSD